MILLDINNINIATYGAVLFKSEIQSSNLINESEWLSNSINPLFLNSKYGFKEITLILTKNMKTSLGMSGKNWLRV